MAHKPLVLLKNPYFNVVLSMMLVAMLIVLKLLASHFFASADVDTLSLVNGGFTLLFFITSVYFFIAAVVSIAVFFSDRKINDVLAIVPSIVPKGCIDYLMRRKNRAIKSAYGVAMPSLNKVRVFLSKLFTNKWATLAASITVLISIVGSIIGIRHYNHDRYIKREMDLYARLMPRRLEKKHDAEYVVEYYDRINPNLKAKYRELYKQSEMYLAIAQRDVSRDDIVNFFSQFPDSKLVIDLFEKRFDALARNAQRNRLITEDDTAQFIRILSEFNIFTLHYDHDKMFNGMIEKLKLHENNYSSVSNIAKRVYIFFLKPKLQQFMVDVSQKICNRQSLPRSTILLIKPEYGKFYSDQAQIPEAMKADYLYEFKYVVCIQNSSILVENCRYSGGQIVSRYKSRLTYSIKDIQTGKNVAARTFVSNKIPERCPSVRAFASWEKGDMIVSEINGNEIDKWLSIFVKPSLQQ